MGVSVPAGFSGSVILSESQSKWLWPSPFSHCLRLGLQSLLFPSLPCYPITFFPFFLSVRGPGGGGPAQLLSTWTASDSLMYKKTERFNHNWERGKLRRRKLIDNFWTVIVIINAWDVYCAVFSINIFVKGKEVLTSYWIPFIINKFVSYYISFLLLQWYGINRRPRLGSKSWRIWWETQGDLLIASSGPLKEAGPAYLQRCDVVLVDE
jgi:hypothetical protein